MDIEKLKNLPLSFLSEVKSPEPAKNAIGTLEQDFADTNKHTTHIEETPIATVPGATTEQKPPITSDSSKNNKKLGDYVKSKNAISIIDMVLPSIICFVISRIGYELDKKDMQLNKDEKEMVEPALQDCLNSINFNLDNPWNMLAIVLGIVYGTKIMDNWDKIERKTEKKTEIEEIRESSTLTDPEKFEQEYNILVESTVKKRRKSKPDAKVWLAKNEAAKLKTLMEKYSINNEYILSHDISHHQ